MTTITLTEARREALDLISNPEDTGPEMMEGALERLGKIEALKLHNRLVAKWGAQVGDGEDWRANEAVKIARRIARQVGGLNGDHQNTIAARVNELFNLLDGRSTI